MNDSGDHQGKRTRRQFIAEAAAVAATASAASCFPDVRGEWLDERSGCYEEASAPGSANARVVEVLDTNSVTTDPTPTIRADVVTSMLSDVLGGLSGGALEPWAALLPDYAAGMRIGLKVNCLNPLCPTSVELTRAVVDSLVAELHMPPSDIVVWDRRLDELAACGYSSDAVGGAQVIGTIHSVTDPTGPGYEDVVCEPVVGKATRLSRILTELTDLSINLPVLKTHGVSGVTAALKNLYGVIDNPGEFHTDLNTALPAIYGLAPVRSRMRLAIIDALITVTTGGTSSPADTVSHRLFAATDLVAADAYALDLVNRLRADKGGDLLPIDATFTTWLDNSQAAGYGSREFQLLPLVRA